jgi:hypothetical protein
MLKFKRSNSLQQHEFHFTLENLYQEQETSSSKKSSAKSFFQKFSPIKKGDTGKILTRKLSELDISLESALSGCDTKGINKAFATEERWQEVSLLRINEEMKHIENKKIMLEAWRKTRSISLESEQEAQKRVLQYEMEIANLKYQAEIAKISRDTQIAKIHNNKIAHMQQEHLTAQESILSSLARKIVLNSHSSRSLPELPSIAESNPEERNDNSILAPTGDLGTSNTGDS